MTSSPLTFAHRFEPGSSAATMLVLHGTGGNEHDLLPLARQIAPAANLLSPRGKVLEHGAPRFFRRLAPGVFDEADLIAQAADLAAFVGAAAAHYGVDPSRVYALGYSNGANIAAALLLLHDATLAGAILLRAMLPIEPHVAPVLTGKPVLVAAGRQDPYAAGDSVQRLTDHLQRAGARVDVRWHAGGHELAADELTAGRDWVAANVR